MLKKNLANASTTSNKKRSVPENKIHVNKGEIKGDRKNVNEKPLKFNVMNVLGMVILLMSVSTGKWREKPYKLDGII